jgi:hypothetical protein
MIASLGTGRQADSSAIRMNTATRPVLLMKSVPALTIGSRKKSVTEAMSSGMSESRIVGTWLNTI